MVPHRIDSPLFIRATSRLWSNSDTLPTLDPPGKPNPFLTLRVPRSQYANDYRLSLRSERNDTTPTWRTRARLVEDIQAGQWRSGWRSWLPFCLPGSIMTSQRTSQSISFTLSLTIARHRDSLRRLARLVFNERGDTLFFYAAAGWLDLIVLFAVNRLPPCHLVQLLPFSQCSSHHFHQMPEGQGPEKSTAATNVPLAKFHFDSHPISTHLSIHISTPRICSRPNAIRGISGSLSRIHEHNEPWKLGRVGHGEMMPETTTTPSGLGSTAMPKYYDRVLELPPKHPQ